MLVYALASTWSPKPSQSIAVVITAFATVGAIIMAHTSEDSSRTDLLRVTMWIIAPIALAQSLATILFLVNPVVEDSYFRSKVFEFLLGDEARYLFTTLPNNVTDPEKSGGLLFVNGNKASMVMAVWGLVYFSLWLRKRSFFMVATTVVCMTGSVFTGSKTAIILCAIIPASFLLIPAVIRLRKNPAGMVFSIAGLGVLAAALGALAGTASDLLNRADEAATARVGLWSAAAGYFQQSPLLGLGFQGWSLHWAQDAASYGLRDNYQPHNLLIWNWANAGLLAPILILLVFIFFGLYYVKAIARANSRREALALSFELAALVWMFAHAMFDNTELFGTSHTLPVFALLAARASTVVTSQIPGSLADGRVEQLEPLKGFQ
ncbi:O-antigen ligase family protein [Arthrobacter sp. NPDC090010]|uniref:O-antigen ligase family protein n=1 Tax=Arthrobacter sp. NPDC090010 TaxID=3363942 RepID=UPI0037F76E3D